MQALRDPILGDVRLLVERHPTLNPEQKTRLAVGLGLIDAELVALRQLEDSVRERAAKAAKR